MRTKDTETHPAYGLQTTDTPQFRYKTTNPDHRQPIKPTAIHTPQPESVLWNTRKHDPTGRNYRARRNCLRRTDKNSNVRIIPRLQGSLRQYIPHLLIHTPTNIRLQHSFQRRIHKVYNNATSFIHMNGHTSGPIPIQCSAPRMFPEHTTICDMLRPTTLHPGEHTNRSPRRA
jgi:hypothetical protein